MAYIESSLMMFRGESHKLLSGNLPDENGRFSSGTYGIVYKNGEIIWEILGRKGRQVVMPISRYYTVSNPWHGFTVVIDIDNGTYILQDSVGQYSVSGFLVNDIGVMIRETDRWNNMSVNGAVFYNPESGRKLSGPVRACFGNGNSFYGVGISGYELVNKLVKLTVDKHGMVEDEEIVDEIKGLSTYTPTIKYKGCDFCIIYNSTIGYYYRFNLKNHGLTQIGSSIPSGFQWLTNGEFAYLRIENSAIYVVITSDLISDDKVIYADAYGYMSYDTLYCRYPYVYIWRMYRATSSSFYVLRIVKLNVITGESQIINPDSIKIGDVTFYTKSSDENGNPQAPYYRLYNPSAIFWNYNEYFEDGVLKDDLQGGYGVIGASAGGGVTYGYAIYMDNLELKPSEHNMAIHISNY